MQAQETEAARRLADCHREEDLMSRKAKEIYDLTVQIGALKEENKQVKREVEEVRREYEERLRD